MGAVVLFGSLLDGGLKMLLVKLKSYVSAVYISESSHDFIQLGSRWGFAYQLSSSKPAFSTALFSSDASFFKCVTRSARLPCDEAFFCLPRCVSVSTTAAGVRVIGSLPVHILRVSRSGAFASNGILGIWAVEKGVRGEGMW